MNPIPTTNAMKPAPGKGVSSFPTPVIKDTVIVEVVNAWKGDYQPLEYGTKWDDVPHASVQGSFPDHKLINQSPNSEDGQWVKRIWANDRVDQDTYNYAIKYSGGSDAHPIYIRTYVELRETYAPVPDLSPDPLFPNALLVEEEVQRQDNELDSRYVKVIRTYETLPGPIISSQRVNERGDLETVEVQEVAPSTPPDPDGLFVTQTQVIKEDVSKGTKTTATVPSYTQLLVKEKKEGLLGETITTDDIVDPATQPDALSQSVVASVVQQTSATKAVKRTTTSTGPTQLSGKRINQRGDIETIVENIVPAGTDPVRDSLFIISSNVEPIDSAKSKISTSSVTSYSELEGSENKSDLLGEKTTIETIVNNGENADELTFSPQNSIIESTITPISGTKARKVTVRSSGPVSLESTSLVDSPIGLVKAQIIKSYVPPTEIPQNGISVIRDSINRVDNVKSQREKITIDSEWPRIYGTWVDSQNGVSIPYYETIVSTSSVDWTGIPFIYTEYEPIDETKVKVRYYDRDAVSNIFSSRTLNSSQNQEVEVALPNKLLNIIAYFGLDNAKGDGFSRGAGSGTSYNYSVSENYTSSSSATGDIYFKIEKGYRGVVPGFKCVFYTDDPTMGQIQLIDELNSRFPLGQVEQYPQIKMISENLVVIGGGKSESKSKSDSASVSLNGSATSISKSTSYNVSVSANSVVVPETLHSEIPVTLSTIGSLGEINVNYSVYPPTLAATNPPSFPAGKYLVSSNFERYKFDFYRVTCIIADIRPQYV
jgi:hypothetical protein